MKLMLDDSLDFREPNNTITAPDLPVQVFNLCDFKKTFLLTIFN